MLEIQKITDGWWIVIKNGKQLGGGHKSKKKAQKHVNGMGGSK